MEMTKTRKNALLGVVAMVGLSLAISIHGFTDQPWPGLLTAEVTRGDVELTVLATGTVEAHSLVSVGAQVSGQLKNIAVALGDVVHSGQILAEIDSLPQQNTLRNKEAALAAARAEKLAKSATFEQAQAAVKRQNEMVRGEATSREAHEAAVAAAKIAAAGIAVVDAQIEQAKIAVDTARLDLGYTKIVSPIDGVVVAVVTKAGQTVNANQEAPTIVKVARLDRMIVKVAISEADVARVKPGQRVTFSTLGDPDWSYPAELLAIEPAPESLASDSDSTATSSGSSSSSEAIYYMGVLDVPNSDGVLRIAMTTQVTIILAEAKDALLIPSAALGERDGTGRYKVRVATAGSIDEYRVSIGLNNNVQAEVLDGLREGQRVVIGEAGGAVETTSSSARQHPGPPPGMF